MGKTTTIINILLRGDYEQILVIHCSSKNTKEFDSISVKYIDSIMGPNEIIPMIGSQKTAIILEDLDYTALKKQEKANLDRLYGFVSTHSGEGRGCTLFCTQQNVFSIPTSIRRMTSVFIMYRMNDTQALKNFSKKTGIDPLIFERYMSRLKGRDALWIDLTPGSPYPLRINGYEMIDD